MKANRTLKALTKCVSWIRSKQNENIILKLKKSDDSFPDKLKINLKRKTSVTAQKHKDFIQRADSDEVLLEK